MRFFLFLLCFHYTLWAPFTPRASITFYNVGQGNCAIVKSPSRKVLIVDAGSSNTIGVSKIEESSKLESLAENIAESIREDVHTSKSIWFVISHPDRDHLNLVQHIILCLGVLADPSDSALGRPLSTYSVGVLFGGKPDIYTKKDSADLLKFIRTHRIPHIFGDIDCIPNPSSTFYILKSGSPVLPDWNLSTDGSTIDFLSVGAEVLHAKPCSEEENTNAASIVMKIQIAGLSVMLTGDKTKKETKAIITRLSRGGHQGLLASDVLLATHHGSSEDYVEDWAKFVNPMHVVFSSGRSFDHPRSEAFWGYSKYLRTGVLPSLWHFVQFQGDLINYVASPIYFKSLIQETPRSLDKGRGYVHALTNQNVFVTANQGDITFYADGRPITTTSPFINPDLTTFPIGLIDEFLRNPSLLDETKIEIEEVNLDGEPSVISLMPSLSTVPSLGSLKRLSMKTSGLSDRHVSELSKLIAERTNLSSLDLTGNPFSDIARAEIQRAWGYKGLMM